MCSWTSVWSGSLAWSRQTPYAHRPNFGYFVSGHNISWQPVPHVQRQNLCSISHQGIGAWTCCPSTASGKKQGQNNIRIIQVTISKPWDWRKETEDIKSQDLQVPCTRWLRIHYSAIWHDRLVLYSASKFFCLSRSDLLNIQETERMRASNFKGQVPSYQWEVDITATIKDRKTTAPR